MTKHLRLFLIACVATTVFAQGRGGPVNVEAPVKPVPFERILRSSQEPQNWLTYSGSVLSQRHSALTQITTANVKNLELQWVSQVLSRGNNDKWEASPLVIDGVQGEQPAGERSAEPR